MNDRFADDKYSLLVQPEINEISRGQQALYRVAVTGHRALRSQETIYFVRRAFQTQLSHLQRVHSEGLIAISGLAEGADTIFAQVAIALHIPLDTIAAYAGQLMDFPPGAVRDEYIRLCACSRSIHTLPFSRRSNEAYMAMGYKLVDSCDLLVAAWDGLPARAKGGTGDVVAYALLQRRPIVHIHTVHHAIMHYSIP
jgi:hypothetical protein